MRARSDGIFKDVLYYKPTLHEVIARYRAFYAAEGAGHLCTFVGVPYRDEEPLEAMPLTSIDWAAERGLEEYLDLSMRNLERIWRASREVADDGIPSAYLNLGIGDYSAYVAGEVIFGEDTSWAIPVIASWADLERLDLSEDNRWVRVLERAIRHICGRCRPVGIPVVRGYYSPLDLARALRGDALFTDLYDAPREVHRLLAFCARATIWLAERLQGIIGEWYGGQVAGAWMPPGTICLSEDTACLLSPALYAGFARPYTQVV
ncbi:MAG: uroporphyrinogen decarboxylase family protein, partial [Anaerolineae bacterium]|nr:uroporphyrinogen decarboxylase family protein [Anaerolineae bacterium]